MKRVMAISIAVLAGLLLSTAVYAWWDDYGWGGYGMGYGPYSNVDNVKKFQKDTLGLRDELGSKQVELQNEYSKPNPDSRRIVTLKKEIIALEAKIQDAAVDYNTPGGGYIGGRTGYGMGHGYGMMGSGCGCGNWGW